MLVADDVSLLENRYVDDFSFDWVSTLLKQHIFGFGLLQRPRTAQRKREKAQQQIGTSWPTDQEPSQPTHVFITTTVAKSASISILFFSPKISRQNVARLKNDLVVRKHHDKQKDATSQNASFTSETRMHIIASNVRIAHHMCKHFAQIVLEKHG